MTHRTTIVSTLVCIALLSLAGCKDGGESEASASPAPSVDVAAINAAVPDALSAKISFSVETLDKGRITVAVPSSWETGNFPGRYKPSDEADLGFFTDFLVGSTCGGSCAPKDWKATADKDRFAQLTGGDYKIVADEALESGRFVHAVKNDRVELAFAWWKEGASRYFFCSASLADSATDAVAAFVKACRSAVITRWE